uniref:Uncharacterized protein n=1 Tax=Knipowitschia caucasica TaxID=637954 RepID=A0AAV2L9G9_KNICA
MQRQRKITNMGVKSGKQRENNVSTPAAANSEGVMADPTPPPVLAPVQPVQPLDVDSPNPDARGRGRVFAAASHSGRKSLFFAKSKRFNVPIFAWCRWCLMLPRRLDCFLDWLPASAACHSLSRCVPAVPTITLAPGAASGQATLCSSQSVDYNPVTGRPAPRSSQPAMRLLFVAFLLASLRLLSTPAPSMALRYTSSQLIRRNHRAPPSLDITSTLQQHCLVRRRPYIHRGSRRNLVFNFTGKSNIPSVWSACRSMRSSHWLGSNNIRIRHPSTHHTQESPVQSSAYPEDVTESHDAKLSEMELKLEAGAVILGLLALKKAARVQTQCPFLSHGCLRLSVSDNFRGGVVKIDRCHRALTRRPPAGQRPRAVIMKLHNFQDKVRIMQAARRLKTLSYKGASVMIFEDFSAAVVKKRQEFTAVKRRCREQGIVFAMLYPAVLRIRHRGEEKLFRHPANATGFLDGLIGARMPSPASS